MRLRDRKALARLMVIQRLSQRQLAEAAGWRSHSYVGRLLRAEAVGVEAGAAARIARALGVGLHVLFEAEPSPESAVRDHHKQHGPPPDPRGAPASRAPAVGHDAAVRRAVERHGLIGYYAPVCPAAAPLPHSAP